MLINNGAHYDTGDGDDVSNGRYYDDEEEQQQQQQALMTKYTFFYTSVGGLYDVTDDVTAGASVGDGAGRGSHKGGEVVTTSIRHMTSLAKRSYLHWSISDCSDNPRHFLLCPRQQAAAEQADSLTPADPNTYDDMMTSSSPETTFVTHRPPRASPDKGLSGLRNATYSEGVTLSPHRGVELQQQQQQPAQLTSSAVCFKNSGGRRRYKSSAHIQVDLGGLSPPVYSLACFALPCTCSVCCDQLEAVDNATVAKQLHAWFRSRIDAVPVAFSNSFIYNFQFQQQQQQQRPSPLLTNGRTPFLPLLTVPTKNQNSDHHRANQFARANHLDHHQDQEHQHMPTIESIHSVRYPQKLNTAPQPSQPVITNDELAKLIDFD